MGVVRSGDGSIVRSGSGSAVRSGTTSSTSYAAASEDAYITSPGELPESLQSAFGPSQFAVAEKILQGEIPFPENANPEVKSRLQKVVNSSKNIITEQVAFKLDTSIQSAVKNTAGLNIGLDDLTAKDVSSRVANEFAAKTTSLINQKFNERLDAVTGGSISLSGLPPIEIVGGNADPEKTKKSINDFLQRTVKKSVNQQITGRVFEEIENALPGGILKKLGVDPATIAGEFSAAIGGSITDSIGIIVNQGVDAVFAGGEKPEIVKNVASFFEGLTPENAIEKAGEFYDEFVSSTAFTSSRDFSLDNVDNTAKEIAEEFGFIDPNAKFPTNDYQYRSEVNKLAQGDFSGTAVPVKNKERISGVKLPGGQAFDQPISPYKALYPFNKVTQTESGHIIEIDDTPGAERIHIYHKSGTFIEVDANGTMVQRVRGSSYNFIDRNGKLSISGQGDISVGGDLNVFVGQDASIEVEGDVNIKCFNDITAEAAGNINLTAAEEFNIVGSNVNIEAYDRLNMKANNSFDMFVIKDYNIRSNGNAYVQIVQDVHILSNANIYTQAVNAYDYLTGSKFSQATGQFSFKSTGDFNVDGDNVYLNSSKASDSIQALTARLAHSANIGTSPGRIDIVKTDVKDPLFFSTKDGYTLLLEEEGETSAYRQSLHNFLVSQGIATEEQLGRTPIEIESAQVSSTRFSFIEAEPKLKNKTIIPGNFQLSPSFTVNKLTKECVLTKDELAGSEDASFGEILFNLQIVALNILEPAYKVYPNLVVLSGFRNALSSSPNSIHKLGRAVDIGFKGDDPEDVYIKAKTLAKVLKYDQLILHYNTYTKNAFLHISIKEQANRNQILTFWNNEKYKEGLYYLK